MRGAMGMRIERGGVGQGESYCQREAGTGGLLLGGMEVKDMPEMGGIWEELQEKNPLCEAVT